MAKDGLYVQLRPKADNFEQVPRQDQGHFFFKAKAKADFLERCSVAWSRSTLAPRLRTHSSRSRSESCHVRQDYQA